MTAFCACTKMIDGAARCIKWSRPGTKSTLPSSADAGQLYTAFVLANASSLCTFITNTGLHHGLKIPSVGLQYFLSKV